MHRRQPTALLLLLTTTERLLQRVYGVTFPDKEGMADYKHRMEEARKRDHRTQGTKHELFFFDKLSPGSCFFLPHGARVYNLLMEVRPVSPLLAARLSVTGMHVGGGLWVNRQPLRLPLRTPLDKHAQPHAAHVVLIAAPSLALAAAGTGTGHACRAARMPQLLALR